MAIDCKDSMIQSAEVRRFKDIDGGNERDAICLTLSPPCTTSGTELTLELSELKQMVRQLEQRGRPAIDAAVENLLAHAAATLISEVHAIDLRNPQQLLVLELAPDTTQEQAQNLQEMMSALSSMTGLSGVLVGDQHKLSAKPMQPTRETK